MKKRDETRASCSLFIILHSLGCLFGPLRGNATTYSSDTSSLQAPSRLLIRRRGWNFLTFLILCCSAVPFLREQQYEMVVNKCMVCDRIRREMITVGCLLLVCFLESMQRNKNWVRRATGNGWFSFQVFSIFSVFPHTISRTLIQLTLLTWLLIHRALQIKF